VQWLSSHSTLSQALVQISHLPRQFLNLTSRHVPNRPWLPLVAVLLVPLIPHKMAATPTEDIRAESYVGFDSITRQIEHKLLKRGFQFNVIVVGA
jgi:hypothetical protein